MEEGGIERVGQREKKVVVGAVVDEVKGGGGR